MLALIESKHLCGDRLKRTQQFTIVLGDERYIGAAQFDVNLAPFKAFRIACAVPRSDAVLEAQAAQLIEMGEESGYFLCSFLQIGNRHNDLVSQSRAGVWKSGSAFSAPSRRGESSRRLQHPL